MSEFSLESFAGKIHYGKTRDYFQEVLSSYQNGNYRSAVVMLWSVAICDIVFKLQNLVDLYEDKTAKSILTEMAKLQEADPKSSAWELNLIEETHKRTFLLNSSEYENLRYLQKQRHLSAHPTLNADRELHNPNKDTVRSLIRNTLEDLLVKPPFYTKQITTELLADIAEAAPAINDIIKVKKYVESRYLNRLKPEVELSIFKTLWKLVFTLENDECTKNRNVNFRVLKVISDRHHESVLKKIIEDQDYYSNISTKPKVIILLAHYLSKNSKFYDVLNEGAKLKIEHFVRKDNKGKLYGWFLQESLEDYYSDILNFIVKNPTFAFKESELKYLLEISDTAEWENLFCCILSAYYCASEGFDVADSRFQNAISPHLNLFNKEALLFLINRIETNGQVYRRGKAIEDHQKIKQKLYQLCGEEFDLEPYPHFKRNVDVDMELI
jgi:hypothetical protein